MRLSSSLFVSTLNAKANSLKEVTLDGNQPIFNPKALSGWHST
jgi:hypothetical protein